MITCSTLFGPRNPPDTRHEQGAAYMALGAALATGKPQACAVVPGPGLLNASAALLTAYSMNAPVLALVGQIPDADIGRKLGHLHEINDQAGILARLVDHAKLVPSPSCAAMVAEAFRAMAPGARVRPRSNAASMCGANPATTPHAAAGRTAAIDEMRCAAARPWAPPNR